MLPSSGSKMIFCQHCKWVLTLLNPLLIICFIKQTKKQTYRCSPSAASVTAAFMSAQTSLAILFWFLSSTRRFYSQIYILFFIQFCVNSRDCFAWKYLERSSFWNTQTSASGTNNHTSKSLRSQFSHSDVWCEHYLKLLTCICMILHIVLLPQVCRCS